MIDGHIHIEYGDYTLDWIQKFVDKAVEMELDEIRLLEHNYMFKEFEPMYDTVRAKSDFVDNWFLRKAGKKSYEEYLDLIDKVRARQYPVKIKFGLEVCFFKDSVDLVTELTKDKGFDFLLGSIHFVDNFAFDHTAQLWEGIDVDKTYKTFFEDSIELARSKVFDGLGHPDSIKLFGHRPSYDLTDYYERLALALSDSNMYADQNSGTQRRCPDTSPLGMDKELIKALKRHNVKIITSSDAHHPEDVGYKIRELQDVVMTCIFKS
jgi:histidinol-phosphatase (PHP family)